MRRMSTKISQVFPVTSFKQGNEEDSVLERRRQASCIRTTGAVKTSPLGDVETPRKKRATILEKMKSRKSFAEAFTKDFSSWTKSQYETTEPELKTLDGYRSKLHFVVSKATESHPFNFLIITTIIVNMITIALETIRSYQNQRAYETFRVLSVVYLTIYTVEFLFKIFSEPIKYWENNYNRMDFLVLLISFVTDVFLENDSDGGADVSFLKIFRALRALRALRSISFVRPLQVLVSALLKTMASIFYLVALLLLLMFVWAMIGHYFFGRGPDATEDEWGTIHFSMYQLWVLVTLDSWSDVQDKLVERGFGLSSVFLYVIPWIFVGNFIFTNLFIGVVVQNLEEAQDEEKALRDMKRVELFHKKKRFIIEKQKRDLEKLMKSQETHGKLSLDDFLKTLAGTLNHEDVAPIKTLCCSKMWFETYMGTLKHYEQSSRRMQSLHLQTARRLHEIVERRLETAVSQRSSTHTIS